MERFNLAQRVIAVVALGALLLLAGTYLTTAATFTGWSGYAPLTVGHFAARDGLAPLANFFVWFAWWWRGAPHHSCFFVARFVADAWPRRTRLTSPRPLRETDR